MELYHTTDKRDWYRNVYLKSEHWKMLRAEKLAINPACEDCGSLDRVEPHHLRYRRIFNVKLRDLRSLCRKHHREWHELRPPPKTKRPRFDFCTAEIRAHNAIIFAASKLARFERRMEARQNIADAEREYKLNARRLPHDIRVAFYP